MAISWILFLAPGYARATIEEAAPVPGPPGLPDGRVYEQVSPAAKNGNQAGPGIKGANAYGIAAADGARVLYSDTGPIGEVESGVDSFSVSERSASGWSTKAVLPEPPPQPRDPISPFDPGWLLPSADLSRAAFTAINPFVAAELDYANPNFAFGSAYLDQIGEPPVWLGAPTTADPFPALEEVEFATNLALVGASSDLNTIYFEYYGTLVPEDSPRRPVVAGGDIRAWGLYEWREGHLKAAGILPSGGEDPHAGEEDPYGAVAAGIAQETQNALPPDFDNEVSQSGNTALFVSPAPEAESARPPQLYARLNGRTTVLVSRSEVTGKPSLEGPHAVEGLSQSGETSFAYGTPDGSRVFFSSDEQLTTDAPVSAELKLYQFDVAEDKLTYLPAVTAPILASSEDGSTLVFDDTSEGEGRLAVWSDGKITDVANLPAPAEETLYVAPVRLAGDGSTLVFQTDSPISGFNNGGEFGEVYRFSLATDELGCVSCPPEGQSPTGTASLSNDSVSHSTHLVLDSRGVSEDGSEIFFDTPNPLVPQDENDARDVYEWQGGHLSLISSGKGTSDSLFLDNSASGDDVFFATRENLSGSDTDGSYDVYDARVGGGFAPAQPARSCAGSCPSSSPPPLALTPLASTSLLGAGEQVANSTPPPTSISKPALSRAKKLAIALKACKRNRGKRRRACEATARHRYGRPRSSKRA